MSEAMWIVIGTGLALVLFVWLVERVNRPHTGRHVTGGWDTDTLALLAPDEGDERPGKFIRDDAPTRPYLSTQPGVYVTEDQLKAALLPAPAYDSPPWWMQLAAESQAWMRAQDAEVVAFIAGLRVT